MSQERNRKPIRVLIANRGEIAIRVARACREMELEPVGVYAESEVDAPHVRVMADAYWLPESSDGGLPYLNIAALIDIARRAEVALVHPGYGFLSENAAFAQACQDAGLTFVGPSPAAIAAMGDKVAARRIAVEAGVPVVPGTEGPVESAEAARSWADEHGYPVAIKASGGGGGRGFRVAHGPEEIAAAFEGSSGEAARYFGNPAVYIERYLARPRHVEIQVMADQHGNTVSLGERDCSIQRRHQKLIEETPSPAVTPELRKAMGDAAVALARAVNYVSAGTVEFLLDQDGRFYFLEMNTRIQVEHPVTEMVTGIDLVKEQLRVALGETLSFDGRMLEARGHAIECRINAEDPARNFVPVPGVVAAYREPSGFGVRVDSAMEAGGKVDPTFDSMIAKLVTWGRTRDEAIARMRRALDEYVIEGVPSTIPFQRAVMDHPSFVSGDVATTFLAEHPEVIPAAGVRAGGDQTDAGLEQAKQTLIVEVNGRRLNVVVHGTLQLPANTAPNPNSPNGRTRATLSPKRRERTTNRIGAGPTLTSPIQGKVVRVPVEVGAQVTAGEVVAVIEAMKMENEIGAHRSGVVAEVYIRPGEGVRAGAPLVRIDEA